MTVTAAILWSIVGIMATGGVFILLAVGLGGWLVFKTKTINTPRPFMGLPERKRPGTASYVSDLYDDDTPSLADEDLSPAAARLRVQRQADPGEVQSGVMSLVKGKKQQGG